MGCSSTCPCRIFSSSSFGVLTRYFVSISWVSALVALSMVFRYSLTPPVTSLSGGTPRDFETLSISWSVSVMWVTGGCIVVSLGGIYYACFLLFVRRSYLCWSLGVFLIVCRTRLWGKLF